MISLKDFWNRFVNHKHTLKEIGAAAEDHTHSLQSLGAAAANHTHSAASIGLGLTLMQALPGSTSSSMIVNAVGKSLGVIYISSRGRNYPVVFARDQALQLGYIVMSNRGGEDADRDYDVIIWVGYKAVPGYPEMCVQFTCGQYANGIQSIFML